FYFRTNHRYFKEWSLYAVKQNQHEHVAYILTFKKFLGKPRAVYEYKKEEPSKAKLICSGTMIFLFKVNQSCPFKSYNFNTSHQ
ncbi:TPA: hypothetical protein ACF0RU_002228, partial [Legionella pneumophila]